MKAAQGIASPRAQIQLCLDASELAPWATAPALGSAGTQTFTQTLLVGIACAWAHSAPPMGIPNLLPFPTHPHFRFPLAGTPFPPTEKTKKQLPTPQPFILPQTSPWPEHQGSLENPLLPTEAQQRCEAASATRAGLMLQPSRVGSLHPSLGRGLLAAGEVS